MGCLEISTAVLAFRTVLVNCSRKWWLVGLVVVVLLLTAAVELSLEAEVRNSGSPKMSTYVVVGMVLLLEVVVRCCCWRSVSVQSELE